MKTTTSLLLHVLACAARIAEAATAHVYTYDPQASAARGQSGKDLSPVAARLVLAQRVGVEDYHQLDLMRQEAVEAINDYGKQTPLFAKEDGRNNAFILLEGVTESIPFFRDNSARQSFGISPAPNSAATRGLFVDLVKQENPASTASDNEIVHRISDANNLGSGGNVFYLAKSVEDMLAMWEKFEKAGTFAITAITTPADAEISRNEGKFQWGTYEMPNKKSMLQKRQRLSAEAPLSMSSDTITSELSEDSPVPEFQANNTTPLRGILPACFTSESACESATRNCTGHGKCGLKYHDADSLGPGGQTGLDCWSCQCTKPKSEAGKKTTVWGGPACQKKDVSVEFWLIALFTVAIIGLVSFAVGTIWEMGSQELPSVIGAGVSGPTARK
ncbi:putative endoplasmic reticulum membrane protein [Cercospora zeina]